MTAGPACRGSLLARCAAQRSTAKRDLDMLLRRGEVDAQACLKSGLHGNLTVSPDVISLVASSCGYYRCNGLQWKWLRTAINENLGPDYLPLSIPSGRDYLPPRLLLSSWDCNRRRWDHITCDSPEPPSSACLYARGSICISRERFGGAPVSYISGPGTESVSSHLKAPY